MNRIEKFLEIINLKQLLFLMIFIKILAKKIEFFIVWEI